MRLRIPALAAVLLLLLAGCGEDDSSSAVAGEAAGSGGPASGVTDPTETESPSDGETTPPGTELSYGDTATVEIETYGVDPDSGEDQPGLAEWTVTSVEPGAEAGGSEMLEPWKISITLTAVTDLSGSFLLPSLDFEGLDATGENTIFNVEPGCESEVDTASLEAGETLELCVAVTAFEKGDLTGVRYTSGDAYDEDTGQPIVWKP